MTVPHTPMCMTCIHFHADTEALTCDAFPDGIPESIISEGADHRQPIDGDGGIQFEVQEQPYTEAILSGYDVPLDDEVPDEPPLVFEGPPPEVQEPLEVLGMELSSPLMDEEFGGPGSGRHAEVGPIAREAAVTIRDIAAANGGSTALTSVADKLERGWVTDLVKATDTIGRALYKGETPAQRDVINTASDKIDAAVQARVTQATENLRTDLRESSDAGSSYGPKDPTIDRLMRDALTEANISVARSEKDLAGLTITIAPPSEVEVTMNAADAVWQVVGSKAGYRMGGNGMNGTEFGGPGSGRTPEGGVAGNRAADSLRGIDAATGKTTFADIADRLATPPENPKGALTSDLLKGPDDIRAAAADAGLSGEQAAEAEAAAAALQSVMDRNVNDAADAIRFEASEHFGLDTPIDDNLLNALESALSQEAFTNGGDPVPEGGGPVEGGYDARSTDAQGNPLPQTEQSRVENMRVDQWRADQTIIVPLEEFYPSDTDVGRDPNSFIQVSARDANYLVNQSIVDPAKVPEGARPPRIAQGPTPAGFEGSLHMRLRGWSAATFQADTAGIIVTVEPGPAEKIAMAIPGQEPANRLHVTLCSIGSLDAPPDKATVVGVLDAISQVTPMMAGQVGGIGWFGNPTAITVALVDAPGLGLLRSLLVEALMAANVAYDTEHDFQPHVTLAYNQQNADSLAGLPLTFGELRLRWGTEVLAFDLTGIPESALETAPSPTVDVTMPYDIVADHPDCASGSAGTVAVVNAQSGAVMGCHPDEASAQSQIAALLANEPAAASVASPQEIAMSKTTMQVPMDVVPPVDTPVVEDVAVSVDMTGITDADLTAELARRLVEQVVTEAEASGIVIDEEGRAELDASSLDDVQEAIAEVIEDMAEDVMEDAQEDVVAVDAVAPVMSIGSFDAEQFDWEGVLTVEGMRSGDGRMIEEGSLTWRELPLPVMLQTANAPGHDGSVICGSIAEIDRMGQNITGRGRFDSGPAGQEAMRLIAEGTMRGVSVDIDMAVVCFVDPETGDEVGMDDYLFGGADAIELLVGGRVMGVTITPFPAFQEAFITIISANTDEALVAAGALGDVWRTFTPAVFALAGGEPISLVASAGKETAVSMLDRPPADWFTLKPMSEPEPFTVHADGRCYGLIAAWGSCHIGFTDRCVQVPRNSDFAAFYNGLGHKPESDLTKKFYNGKTVITAEGTAVKTGPIFTDTVHPSLRATASDAQAQYAHTGCAAGDVCLYVNEYGIVAAGAMRSDLDAAQERAFRASDVSPDWRTLNGELKLVALLSVNCSGFLVDALAASGAASIRPNHARGMIDTTNGQVLSLVAAGGVTRRRSSAERMAVTVEALVGRLDAQEAEIEALRSFQRQVRAERALAKIAFGRPQVLTAAEGDCGCGKLVPLG